MHKKNGLLKYLKIFKIFKIFKNLTKYRSKNNFVGPSK